LAPPAPGDEAGVLQLLEVAGDLVLAAAEVVLEALGAGEATALPPGVGEEHGVQQLGVPREARRVQQGAGQQDEPAP
jgi:hypothetical protein